MAVLTLSSLQRVVSRDVGYRTSFTWVWITALPLTNCVISDKSLKFSESQFSHLQNGDDKICSVGLLY